MHELGVVIEIVKTVEQFAKDNGVSQIQKIVLQIGELSSIVPKYVEDCYPMAVEGTILENAALDIEILAANARCRSCGKVFSVLEYRQTCPSCSSTDTELLGGREFLIKNIVAC